MPIPVPPHAVTDTVRWLERAVIGLNLCPFAKGPQAKGQVHVGVSAASDWPGVLADLATELSALLACGPEQRETTLLVVPNALNDFDEFNDFLGLAERTLASAGARGVVQLASFHPDYRFAGTDAEDITNFTNRSPYPILHLLREASVERAVQAFPQAEVIYEANMDTLRQLGAAGWQALQVGRT